MPAHDRGVADRPSGDYPRDRGPRGGANNDLTWAGVIGALFGLLCFGALGVTILLAVLPDILGLVNIHIEIHLGWDDDLTHHLLGVVFLGFFGGLVFLGLDWLIKQWRSIRRGL